MYRICSSFPSEGFIRRAFRHSVFQCSQRSWTNDRRIIVVSASSSVHFSSRWVHTRCGTALLPLCRSAGRTARHLHQLFQMEFSLFFRRRTHRHKPTEADTKDLLSMAAQKRQKRKGHHLTSRSESERSDYRLKEAQIPA